MTPPELWAAAWSAAPGRPVLVDGRGTVVAAGELEDLTARVAGVLRRQGVGRGDRVLWRSRATVPAVVALVGILRAGAALVPLSPTATARELEHVVTDAAPVAAVSEPRSAAIGASWTVEGIMAEAMRLPSSDIGVPVLSPTDDALVVYTSGTTGSPKGAVHTHASLLAGVRTIVAAWEWQPEDRLILALPLFHVHGLCAGLFGTLAAGASATLLHRFDEDAVVGRRGHQHHVLRRPHHVPPARFVGARRRRWRDYACRVSGSAPLAADLWQALDAYGLHVLERYGMTETLLTVSNPLHGERRPGSVGPPLPGAQIALDRRRRRGRGGAARTHAVALSRLLGPTGRADGRRRLVRHRGPGLGGRGTVTSPSAAGAPS